MILYTLTTPPATYPISTAEAKAACDVTFSDDDDLIDAYIAAAAGLVEEMAGKSLVSQTWTRTSPDAVGCVALTKPPLIAVTAMTYYDRDDVEQTLDVSDFYVYKDEDRAWIEPKNDADWPDFMDRQDALSIEFTSGFATVPPELVQAVKMLVSHWYDHRMTATEAKQTEVPYGVSTLVGLRRKGWIAA